MNNRAAEVVIAAGGAAYLVLLTLTMSTLSFDIWGALILIPVWGVAGFALVNVLFRGPFGTVRKALYWGLALKLVGAAARYWVGFEAYGGGIDAAEYHRIARLEAGGIWAGDRSVFDAIPTGTGTEFAEQFTAFAYTMTGGSQFGGFVTFAFLAYIGVVCFVKAAHTALPDMALRKYAWVCVLAPSLIYWPSSIGKEALIIFGLGVGSYGIASLVSGGRRSTALLTMGIGLGFAGLIRPHIAGIWIGAAIPALILSIIRGHEVADRGSRRRGRLGLILVLVGGVAGLGLIASFTLRFLTPEGQSDQSVADLFAETTRRTAQAGSNFTPLAIDNPVQWPYAIVRTLLRPLPIEATGLAQLVSAAEIMLLVGLYAWSWRRVRGVARAVMTQPYVLFALTAIALTGLAYTSFANLGVLTRQKSLIFPLLLMIPCLPISPARAAEPHSVAPRQINAERHRREHVTPSTRLAPDANEVPNDDYWAARAPVVDESSRR